MKKIFFNYMYQASSQLLLIVIPIITMPIVANALGSAGVGYWNYINSIVNYFLLFASFGLSVYGMKEISENRETKKQLSKKFWELELFNAVFSCLALCSFILVGFFLKEDLLYFSQVFAIGSALFDISWFFSGIEQFKKVTIRNFFIKAITLLFIFLLIKNESDLGKFFLINSLSLLISQIFLWISLDKEIVWVSPAFNTVKLHFKQGFSYFVTKLGTTIFNSIHTTLLGLWGSISSVGIYAQALTIVLMLSGLIGALNMVLLPKMSRLKKEKNSEYKIVTILNKTFDIQLFITIGMLFGLIAISPQFVPWFFGPQFQQMIDVLPLLTPLIISQSLSRGIGTQYLVPNGKVRLYNYSILIGVIVAIIIDVITIPILEIYGAVISVVCSQLCVCLLLVYFLNAKTSFRFQITKIIGYILVGSLMLIIIKACTSQLGANAMTTCIQIVVGGLIYILGTWLFKLNPIITMLKKRLL